VSTTPSRLDEDRALVLLAAGGVEPLAGVPGRDDALPAYNGLLDPPGVEQLGIELATRARELDPSVVLIWERPEDVALAHVVGRELGLSVVRAFDADGLVGHGPGIEPGSRVLLVADAVRDGHIVRAAWALAEQLEGTLVGTAVLLATPALDEVADQAGRIVCLVRPPASGESDGAAR
jgi:hypothetical protein